MNYRNYDSLIDCLESVQKSSYRKIEVIVVDNDSDDENLSKLQNKFPKILFFGLKENLNYSEGNNFGISKSEGEFIVLLNNDTKVCSDWLEPLVACALESPEAFYQPLIMFMDSPNQINSLGNTVHPFGFAFPISLGSEISSIDPLHGKSEVFYCSGACVFTSRGVLERLGGLDSNYWTYYEDVNLGWRGRLLNIGSFVVPESKISHSWGGTYGKQLSSKKLYLLERGRISTILRNYSSRSLVRIMPFLFFLDLFMFFFLLHKPALAYAKLKVSKDIFLSLGYLSCQRKRLQAIREIKDEKIIDIMTPSIVHPYFETISERKRKLLLLFSKKIISFLLQ